MPEDLKPCPSCNGHDRAFSIKEIACGLIMIYRVKASCGCCSYKVIRSGYNRAEVEAKVLRLWNTRAGGES